MIGGRFNKQGDLHNLSWAIERLINLHTHPTEFKNMFRHIYHPDDLKNTLFSQGNILQNASHMGTMYIPSTEEASEEPPVALVQLTGQTVVMSSKLPSPNYACGMGLELRGRSFDCNSMYNRHYCQNLRPKPERFS